MIIKYELDPLLRVQYLEMPKNAEILCVQPQKEKPCIWAIVDENEIKIIRHFEIFATGEPMIFGVDRKYIGTYQLAGGALEFHLFELWPDNN